ncbi:ROK family protein [Pseudomonas sp. TWP3-2]|uniref:ROK family protein n=1 Tax=Pseudomonas sp. TWP3-2 TaxID=2804574 RepID=UPI003CEC4AF9
MVTDTLERTSRPLAQNDDAHSVIVFDIGGTHFRSAHFHPERGLSHLHSQPASSFLTHPLLSARALKDALLDYLVNAARESGLRQASISMGAAMNARTGLVYGSGPLWGADTTPFDLRSELSTRAPEISWHSVNDVTAVLIHYASLQRQSGLRKVLLITISSGIASRTIDLRNNRIALDDVGLQGEIGHLPVTLPDTPGGPLPLSCDCGGKNHLAAFSSGRGMKNLHDALVKNQPSRWASSAMARLIEVGCGHEEALQMALERQDEYAEHLLHLATRPIADVVRMALTLDPEIDRVVFVGGVSVNLETHYLRLLARHFQEAGLYLTSQRLPRYLMDRIVVARPEQADGLAGAGLFALQAREHYVHE